MTDKNKFPEIINIDVTDDESVEQAAKTLGVSPEHIVQTINFSHQVFRVAESRGLTKGQLVTALLSVVGILVKEAGDEEGRKEMCMRMFEGIWASAELEGLPSLVIHTARYH